MPTVGCVPASWPASQRRLQAIRAWLWVRLFGIHEQQLRQKTQMDKQNYSVNLPGQDEVSLLNDHFLHCFVAASKQATVG
jgi:hypothetical protein